MIDFKQLAKQHGPAMISGAMVAIIASFALRSSPSVPAQQPSSVPSMGSPSLVMTHPRTAAQAPSCAAVPGHYADQASIPGTANCIMRDVQERPAALSYCGTDSTGVFAHVIPGNQVLVIRCDLNRPN